MTLSETCNTELISVIVPVYNTGNYLEECLQSIIRQTYSRFEVILLDDASTDHSASICKKYAKEDGRFLYYHFDERKGQGCRRNYGINIAHGNVIAFVDSDDVIAETMLEFTYQLMCRTQSQIVIFRLQTTPGFVEPQDLHTELINGHEYIRRFCSDPGYGAFSCNKLFRKKALLRCGEYPVDMFYEDIVFIPQVCMNEQYIVYCNQSFYYYRQHPDSVAGSRYFSGKLDQIKAYRMLIPAVLKHCPDLSHFIYAKGLYGVMSVYHVLLSDVSSPDALLRHQILTAAREMRKNLSIFHAPLKKKILIYTFALCLPALYDVILRFLYKKISHRGK